MVGWLALGLSVVGTVYFVAFTEESWTWKGLMVALTTAPLVLQFVVRVHS